MTKRDNETKQDKTNTSIGIHCIQLVNNSSLTIRTHLISLNAF